MDDLQSCVAAFRVLDNQTQSSDVIDFLNVAPLSDVNNFQS